VTLIVVGVSHHTAPVELLERLSVTVDETPPVLAALVAQPHVSEAVVLSTCNRVEVYAVVTAFHGGLHEIATILAARTGLDVQLFASHLYVHYDSEAARHALRVASGLDSMVVGEAQSLGQLRLAYAISAERDAAGRFLHELMQQALRVGKRVHAETGIDRAGRSVVTAALGLVPDGIEGRRVLVIGAGSMGALTLATLTRSRAAANLGAGPDELFVANRGADRAERLAARYGARVVEFNDLEQALSTVDIVVCATASRGPVLSEAMVRKAMADRGGKPLVLLDLAVPRDVAAEVVDVPGVTLIDISRVATATMDEPSAADRDAAEAIVATEVEAFLTWLRGAEVAPTVAALRARADAVVESELSRLMQRRPELSDDQRSEVAHAIHRVVQRLLHSPTVRVRQLATSPGGDQYAALLRELFDLAVPGAEDDLSRAVAVQADALPRPRQDRESLVGGSVHDLSGPGWLGIEEHR
jgi:glutamyl-tRNA reductase